MGLSPSGPLFEKDRAQTYERDVAQNNRRRGPLRFEEGIATDTDVPRDYQVGCYQDTAGDARGRPFTVRKDPGETMRERAHMGSSTWIEAPALLGEFVQGAGTGNHPPAFEAEFAMNPHRPNRAQVSD